MVAGDDGVTGAEGVSERRGMKRGFEVDELR